MPELPEVETIVTGLAPALTGQSILSVEILAKLVVKTNLDAIVGQTITGVRRYGKNILIQCGDATLAIHLGMTGKLLNNGTVSPYARVLFHLSGGTLVYDDIRQFGRIQCATGIPRGLARLGPDPLEQSLTDFLDALKKRRSKIKPLLLDQSFLRGLGNIYADETLFRAGIHPCAIASRLSRARCQVLFQSIRDVLTLAIRHRGSSISDYVDASGERGGFQKLHQVYGKEGEPCPGCGSPIKRIVVAQRGTHFCPTCQRR
ncbi:MAG: bifunctional DNA-formamidopyrimidine glycosylase/DNA-(apurinic or apyrimidinic site) lyase [Candidatus Solibacter usitatus]|nr:bifunctional DNA-formamidopyrimidine glycosylase/DNA-(apurinic or apyrimidinic site) lyase [Candidatus Solibacter usitatus]